MTDTQAIAIIAAIVRETHGGCNVQEAVKAAREYLDAAINQTLEQAGADARRQQEQGAYQPTPKPKT